MTDKINQDETPLPRSVAGYQVMRLLGEGGMSVVYAAMQREPKRLVALKVLKGASFPPSALRRFKREVEILGKLRHPGIAQVYDAGTWDDGSGEKPYFAMEFIPGSRELTDFLEERKATLEQRLKLFIRICAAVDHGHQRKIVHRDLKPGNILVDENGDPRIIDYGVARVSEVEINSQTMHTEAGRLVGTVQYMAPEQVDMAMQDIDGRCDVYALGVLLFQVCTGAMPYEFVGQPIFEAMRVIREDEPPSPRPLNAEVDRDLETIIFKCLEKERGRRYRNAGELGRDILRYLKNEPIEARRPSILYKSKLYWRRHRSPLIAATVVAIVLALSAVAIIFIPRWLSAEHDASMRLKVSQAEEALEKVEQERDDALSSQPPEQWVPTDPYVLNGLTNRVRSCGANAPGTVFAAISDTTVGIWSIPDGKRWTDGDTGELKPMHMAFGGEGRILAIAGESEAVCIDLETGISHRWNLPRDPPDSIAVSRDGERVAIGFSDLSLGLYSIDGVRHGRTTSTSGRFTELTFGPGNLLAGLAEERLTVWKLEDGLDVIDRLDVPTGGLGIAFAPGGTYIYMVTEEGTIVRCEPGSGLKPERNSLVAGPLKQAAFDPMGGMLLVVDQSSVTIWDIIEGTPHSPTMPLQMEPGSYALGPGGSFFARGTRLGVVMITPME